MFLYTDGLTEARNQAAEQFGRQHTLQLAADHCSDTVGQLVELMENEVSRHVGEAVQSDDITLLAIRWKPSNRLTMTASMDDIGLLAPFITYAAQQVGLDTIDAKRLRLATEEAVANVINYSQANTITLKVTVNGPQLELTIDDDGQPFDPTAESPTDLSVPADKRPPGGLGIMLLHKMADSLSYQRINSHNLLKIVKVKK